MSDKRENPSHVRLHPKVEAPAKPKDRLNFTDYVKKNKGEKKEKVDE